MLKNGKRKTPKRLATAQARARIIELARARGQVTNAQAKKAAGLDQVWFHLNYLRKIGLLRYVGYNTWKPDLRRSLKKLEL